MARPGPRAARPVQGCTGQVSWIWSKNTSPGISPCQPLIRRRHRALWTCFNLIDRRSLALSPAWAIMPWLQLRFDYDTTWSDYDPTTTCRARLLPFDAIRHEQKINMTIFRRSRVVVVSQSNRNCDIDFSQIADTRCAHDEGMSKLRWPR